MKFLLAFFLSFCIAGTASAAQDPERYLLTVPTLQKIKAINSGMAKLPQSEDNGSDEDEGYDDNGEITVTHFAKKIDANPQAKALLVKHGMSSQEFALASLAMMAAAMHLAFEPSLGKEKAASLFAGYTKERQANIELLRKHPEFMQKSK